MAGLETIIRKDPTQYLWLHRRWKHSPPEPKNRKKKRIDGADAAGPMASPSESPAAQPDLESA
jgi:hypothetical protein